MWSSSSPSLTLGRNTRDMQKLPKVTKDELVAALDRLCAAVGTTSRGLNVDAINGPNQWALSHLPGAGWMVVCGLGGCGAALSRWNGYIRYRWNVLMALEMARQIALKLQPRVSNDDPKGSDGA